MRVSGGIPVDRDGRTRGVFTHNPSTFRLSMVAPNLMQIPRGSSDVEKWVKEMFVAPPGYQFWARDFSGIEAVLVGWFAGAREYVRLAKIDVHSFYTAYGLHELDPAGFNANDLPHLEWEDSRLRVRLGEIKKEFKRDRNEVFKHLVHGGNFLQTPAGAQKLIFKETEVQHEVRRSLDSWGPTRNCSLRSPTGTGISAREWMGPNMKTKTKTLGRWAYAMSATLTGMFIISITCWIGLRLATLGSLLLEKMLSGW
jgi:hypothetical protein